MRTSANLARTTAVAVAAALAACHSPAPAAHDAASATDATTADAALTDAVPAARDWLAHPPIAQLDGIAEIWALSDIHGDNAALVKLLAAADLRDSAGDWQGGSAALVIVGDLIDKGPDAVGVVDTLVALQASAAAAGGHVVITMGNHEAEFLADPTNSKAAGSDGFDGELAAVGLSPAATADGSDALGVTLRDLPFAARIDDWFFAHAGDTGGATLAALASSLQTGVDAAGFGASVLADPTSLLEHKFADGIFWEQHGGDPPANLTAAAHALAADHIVMGHEPVAVKFADGVTRKADEMFQRYGLIFLIDTGMSVDVDHTGGALLHITAPADAATAEIVTPDGKHAVLAGK